MNVEITQLQRQQSISAQQRAQLTRFANQKDELHSQLSFLTGLRGGVAAPMMFVAIDRALAGSEVWFESWDFQRAGFEVEEAQEGTNTGYFIVMPPSEGSTDQSAWKIETHMNISGKALDHSALSRFVGRLFDQSEISDVRILNTNLAGDGRFVDFNLVLTVNNATQV